MPSDECRNCERRVPKKRLSKGGFCEDCRKAAPPPAPEPTVEPPASGEAEEG